MNCANCGKANQEDAQFCFNCGRPLTAAAAQSSTAPAQNQGALIVPKRNRKIAMLWLGIPISLLPFAFIVWVMMMFMNFDGNADSPVFNAILWVIGLLGLLAVFGMIAGIPIAIAKMSKKVRDTEHTYDERSGAGSLAEFPEELHGWNWGAAGLGIIWGIYHSVWLSFLSFVPYLNYIWWIVMGLKGSEWAWSAQKWQSVEEFQADQKKWRLWGILVFFVPVLIVLFIMSIGFMVSAR